MTVSVSQLGAVQVGSSATTIFQVGPNTAQVRIVKATFTNTSGGSVNLTVYLVPAGQTPGASNTVISAQAITAGQCYVSSELPGHVLSSGGSLQALASSANDITAIVSGDSVS